MVKATAVYVPNSLMPPFPHALLPSEEHFPPACAAGAPVRTSDPTLRVPLCVAPRVLLLTRDLYLLHPRPSPSSFPPSPPLFNRVAVASAAVGGKKSAKAVVASRGYDGSNRKRGKGSRGNYRKISSQQRAQLESHFQSDGRPNETRRKTIAGGVGIAAEHVKTWFTNRRTKQRKSSGPKKAASSSAAAAI